MYYRSNLSVCNKNTGKGKKCPLSTSVALFNSCVFMADIQLSILKDQ